MKGRVQKAPCGIFNLTVFAVERCLRRSLGRQWLLKYGADTRILDCKYNADAGGWAEFFGNAEAAELIRQSRGS